MSRPKPPRGTSRGSVSSVKTAGSRNDTPYAAVDERTTADLLNLVARWHAEGRTVIAVLTHDPKFDVPALQVALRTNAGYIGAMGSRRTHEDRLVRLREAGMTDAECERLHSPIGLDLGARTPEETAISIAAEIVQARWGGSGARLAETAGPIHPGAPR